MTNKGFTLVPKRKDNSQDISNIFEEDDYDLILIDYNLLGEKGDVVIERIRNLDVFTDIVFYSQNGESVVRNSIKEKELDGVYCSDREHNEFIDKVQKIINTTVKKVFDLNNMRGLVMAHTSELDLVLEDMTKKIIENLGNEEGNKQKETIKKKFIDSLTERMEGIKNVDPIKEIDKIFEKIDSFHKWRALKRMCNVVEGLKEFEPTIEKYKPEVLEIRNILAHVKEEVTAERKKIFKSKLSGHNEFEFNDNKAIEIRNNLRKHSDTFQRINEKFS